MKTLTYDLDGPVHAVVWDGPADRPPFLLVHGLGGHHANWLALGPLLAARARTIAIDLPGFGSTPPAGRAATVPAYTAFVRRFIREHLDGRAMVVGNSMGGTIALQVASSDPAAVAGLILIDPAVPRVAGRVEPMVAGAFAAVMIPRLGEGLIDRRLRRLGPEGVARQTLALCTVDPGRVPPEVIDAHLAIARAREAMPWATSTFLTATRSLVPTLLRTAQFERGVASVRAPTLVLMGSEDRLVPSSAARRLVAGRPGWTLRVLDRLGHAPQLEDARGVMDAIANWLDDPMRASA